MADFISLEGNGTFRGPVDSKDRLPQGRLSASALSDQAKGLSLADLEGDTIQGLDPADASDWEGVAAKISL
jgi:hypothetical protein